MDGRQEVNARIKLPGTVPGDAGYFPLHDVKTDEAKLDFEKEMYPGNESIIK